MYLNNKLLAKTSLGALFVMMGVAIKISGEQRDDPDDKFSKPLGILCFTLGWIAVAYALSCKKKNKLLIILPCALILTSVLVMKRLMAQHKKKGREGEAHIPKVFPIMFAASWVVLGLLCANHFKGPMKLVGLVPPLLVILSMMVVLPVQRKRCVVDGFGVYLFAFAWFILTVINSMR